MAGTTVYRRGTGLAPDSDLYELVKSEGQHANVVADLAYVTGNQVMHNGTSAGLSVDANAEDVETDNAITIRVNGSIVAFAAQAAIDLSALSIATVPGAATISTSKAGAAWVFAHPDGTADVQTDITTATHTTAIIALSQYANPSIATRLLPPTSLHVPIGVVQVTEGGSGAFTWGTDSITTETETYYSFAGRPGVLSAIASFAATGSAATFAYGAGKIVLGTGVYVALTGKTGVTLAGTNIPPGGTGAWLFYALADDNEYAFQLGYQYTSLTAARTAVRNHTRNPLLPVIGVIYVKNNTASDFTPGTTNLDATNIHTTFDISAASTMNAALISLTVG